MKFIHIHHVTQFCFISTKCAQFLRIVKLLIYKFVILLLQISTRVYHVNVE